MKVIMIAATSENGVIGFKGQIPWKLPDDLKRFRQLTQHKLVVMGRNTFESLPQPPLPHRRKIVMTREAGRNFDFCYTANSKLEVFQLAESLGYEELWVIGGSKIYSLFIEDASVIHLTAVHGYFEGDRFFPGLREKWKVSAITRHGCDFNHAYAFDFVDLVRR